MNRNSFFRRVADRILDAETARQIAEQRRALAAHPGWAEGYYHLAQLLRLRHQAGEAKRQLLICLEKKPTLAEAHVALGEIYVAEGDLGRAREHAEYAAALGVPGLLDQLRRYRAA